MLVQISADTKATTEALLGKEFKAQVVKKVPTGVIVSVDGASFNGFLPKGLALRASSPGDELRVQVLSVDVGAKRMLLNELPSNGMRPDVITTRWLPIGSRVWGTVAKFVEIGRAKGKGFRVKAAAKAMLVHIEEDPTCLAKIKIKAEHEVMAICEGTLLQGLQVADITTRRGEAEAWLEMLPSKETLPSDRIHVGALLTGTVKLITHRGVFVDIGEALCGMIVADWLSRPLAAFSVGGHVSVVVLSFSAAPFAIHLRELREPELVASGHEEPLAAASPSDDGEGRGIATTKDHILVSLIKRVWGTFRNVKAAFAERRHRALPEDDAPETPPLVLPQVGTFVHGTFLGADPEEGTMRVHVVEPECEGVLRNCDSAECLDEEGAAQLRPGHEIQGLRVVDVDVRMDGRAEPRAVLSPSFAVQPFPVGAVLRGRALARLRRGLLVDVGGDYPGVIDNSRLGPQWSQSLPTGLVDGGEVVVRVLRCDCSARELELREVRDKAGEPQTEPTVPLPPVGSEISGVVTSSRDAGWPAFSDEEGRTICFGIDNYEGAVAVVRPKGLTGGTLQYPVGTSARGLLVNDVVVAPWGGVLVEVTMSDSACKLSKRVRIGARLRGKVMKVLEKGGLVVAVKEDYFAFVPDFSMLKPPETYRKGDRLEVRVLQHNVEEQKMRVREIRPKERRPLPPGAPILPQVGSVVRGVATLDKLPSREVAGAADEPRDQDLIWDEYALSEDEDDNLDGTTEAASSAKEDIDSAPADHRDLVVSIPAVPCLGVLAANMVRGGRRRYLDGREIPNLKVIDVVVDAESAWVALYMERLRIGEGEGAVDVGDVLDGRVHRVTEHGILVDVGLQDSSGTPCAGYCRWRDLPAPRHAYVKDGRIEGLRIFRIETQGDTPQIRLKCRPFRKLQAEVLQVGCLVDGLVVDVWPLKGIIVDIGSDVEGFVPSHALRQRTDCYERGAALKGLRVMDTENSAAAGCSVSLSELPFESVDTFLETGAVIQRRYSDTVRIGSIVLATVMASIKNAVVVDFGDRSRGVLYGTELLRPDIQAYKENEALLLVLKKFDPEGTAILRELRPEETEGFEAFAERCKAQFDGRDRGQAADEVAADRGRPDVASTGVGVVVPAPALPPVHTKVSGTCIGSAPADVVGATQLVGQPDGGDIAPAPSTPPPAPESRGPDDEESPRSNGDSDLLVQLHEPPCLGLVLAGSVHGAHPALEGREFAGAVVVDYAVRGRRVFPVISLSRRGLDDLDAEEEQRRVYGTCVGESTAGEVVCVLPYGLILDLDALPRDGFCAMVTDADEECQKYSVGDRIEGLRVSKLSVTGDIEVVKAVPEP